MNTEQLAMLLCMKAISDSYTTIKSQFHINDEDLGNLIRWGYVKETEEQTFTLTEKGRDYCTIVTRYAQSIFVPSTNPQS